MTNRNTSIIAVAVVVAVALSGMLGFYFATVTVAHASPTPSTTSVTSTSSSSFSSTSSVASSASAASQPETNTVNLDIIPDWAGAGYDAFVLGGNINGTVPAAGTNTTAPGRNDNNITVTANTPVSFVITTIDDAVLQNFSAKVTTPFVVYNNTDSGQAALQYKSGDTISNMPIGHTFSITSLGVNIPIPPSTVVTFTLTFTKPGIYEYICLTPCGPGMGVVGYMAGYVIVK